MFFNKTPNSKIDELVGGPASDDSFGEAKPASGESKSASEPTASAPEMKQDEQFNRGAQGNQGNFGNRTYQRRDYGSFRQDRFEPRVPYARRERSMEDANVPTEYKEGILDLLQEGNGVLRPKFRPSNEDIYISQTQIRKFNLREGDLVGGQVRAPKQNERYHGLLKVEKVNGIEVEKVGTRPDFDKLTAIYPKAKIKLETGKEPLATRVIDLIAPIGFGQRGLIVSPPKSR